MEDMNAVSVDPEALRAAMRAWTAGVTVVTATHGGRRHGMTVNSFTSISLEPAWISVTLQQSTRTHALVKESGAFAITILAAEQKYLAERFSGKTPSDDRFEGLQTAVLATGSPLIVGGLAWLDCKVVQTITAGQNTLFIGQVLAARGEFPGEPLVYHHRSYWRPDAI